MLKTVLKIAAIAALARLILRDRSDGGAREIRDAGPSQMRNPPSEWDEVDESLDESFPASDPPGTY